MYVVGNYILVEPMEMDKELESELQKVQETTDDMISQVGRVKFVGNGEEVQAAKIKKGDIVHLLPGVGAKVPVRCGGKVYYKATIQSIAFFFDNIKEYKDSIKVETELTREMIAYQEENRRLAAEALRAPSIVIPDGAIVIPN